MNADMNPVEINFDNMRDLVLNTNDVVIEKVETPGWILPYVYVRSIGANERDAYEKSLLVDRQIRTKKGKTTTKKDVDTNGARAKLCVIAICKGANNPERVFKDSDAELIANKNSAAIGKIFDVASRLCGLSNDDVDELLGN